MRDDEKRVIGSQLAHHDAPEKTMIACREAGVELRVSGVEEGATGLVARLRKSATGDVPADLREAIQRHRTALIVRLLASERYPRVGVPAVVRGKTMGQVWGRRSLEDHARFGVEAARLYSNLDDDVVTVDGDGELVNVLGSTAKVMLKADRVRAMATSTGKRGTRPVLATREYPIGDVYPAIPAAACAGYVPIPTIDEVPAEIEGTASPATGTEHAPQSGIADLAARRTRDRKDAT